MINELYPSLKGSLDLLFTEFRGNWAQELLFFTQRMWLWSDLAEVRRLRRTNFLEIAILCEFWLSITNMCDMETRDRRNTEPQLSVYCLEFHCSPVKTLRRGWAEPLGVSEWHLRCQMPPESVEPVSQVSFFNRKQTHVTPRVPASVRWPGLTQY